MAFKLASVSTLAITAALGLTLGACASMPGWGGSGTAPAIQAPADVQWVRDVHSYARPEIARVHHVDLNLAADFERRMLAGTASLSITAEPGATEIILDIRDLDIHGVRSDDGPLDYTIGQESPFMGKPLIIAIPFTEGRIHIDYSTRPEAAALQWLKPEQTAGGRLPYMFSQGQAILTRTWIPTQDSPGIRQTYSARISVPEGMTAVMSAEMLTPGGEPDPRGRAFHFRMDNPVPPYLIAIGVGDIAFQALGARTGVYTEPSMLARSAAEFPEVEAMVEAAEGLYGPYIWGRYDLLVLPPSFPFGGMENPRLTFATPTIIAGDQSLVALVAHELAHSWSGNLVTNATWDDFWLNEGFTVYFENRIMEAVYGRDRAMQEQVLGWEDLQSALATLPPEDTRLKLDLAGRDPDDGMTNIAYEKGAFFLRTIERTVGRDRFDAWLKGYFERNAYRPMTTAMFLEDIRTYLIRGDAALEQALMMDAWVYQPGLPSNAVAPVSQAFDPVDSAARSVFLDGGAPPQSLWQGWNTQQRQRFLAWRPEGHQAGQDWLSEAQLKTLDESLGLSVEGNAEVLFAWLQIAMTHRYEPAVAPTEAFLTGMGRRKFVLPLFQTLWGEGEWGRDLARRIYARSRPLYHPVTSNSVDAVVGVPD
ncbi:M1 family metallopeptidase [Brevundimonas sp.]|uniref:M1 family metallopeptidase n=1 Tax=Brevundimonas sp. TaxID=1871086 RepID=UPI001D6726AF|nr:M1 family metallopeptidase [Brevundimonas sp.]MBL0946868.1 M1 family metallopeptidase [Brevundimonas sp.]